MSKITISESESNLNNLLFIQNDLAEILSHTGCKVKIDTKSERSELVLEMPAYYYEIVGAELLDKIAEIIVVNYKYSFFKNNVKVSGLSSGENEILLASLIAADFDDDKRYTYDRIKLNENIAIDGIYNFRLSKLKQKWEDIISYIPNVFINSQLKEFISYLIENKSKKIYVDNGKVYDNHYKRLIRSELLTGTEKLKIIREVLLSNCGLVSLSGEIPTEDEFYLKEFYGDKIIFLDSKFSEN